MVGEANAHDRARVVRRYLSALDAVRAGRSAAKTAESLHFRMHQIDTELLSADPVRRLHLTQERIDLHAEYLRLTTGGTEMAELEKSFVRVARGYGDRHGISYSAWRQIGVDADVLASAGIKPTNKVRPATNGNAAAPEEAEPAPGAPKKKAAAKKAPATKAPATKAPVAAKKASPAKKTVKKAAAPTAEPEQTNLLA
ncbi:MAG TPA: hypothetical protein VHC63_14165 [Acidimicrobiales bacterium]|nr:hypothetical protein [Acidimicrobiales bacterium]